VIVKIDVEGEARHIPVEGLDGRAALGGKAFLFRDGGNDPRELQALILPDRRPQGDPRNSFCAGAPQSQK
jgi:hypothetical protein